MAPSPVDELALLDLERSNKGASKQRRDQINSEIGVMRDLLPLPESSRQRLSQLQVMSLSCVFIRKCNILQKMIQPQSCPNDAPCEFSQSLTGFLLVTTRDGKLVYISENVTEYLGHSMVDMKTQGDSLFDIVDKRDHGTVQAQLMHGGGDIDKKQPISFFCRMNMSRTLKRQAGFGDVKVMHVRGHFVSVPGQDSGNEQQVFISVCSPLITPDVKETLIQNNTMVFKSIHHLDMNFLEISQNGEYHLGIESDQVKGKSWYSCLHPEDIHEAREKHIQLVKSRHEMGSMMTVRMITGNNDVIWVNIVMHVRQALLSNSDEPVIFCINQVISEQEAYQFKIQGQLFALYATRASDFFFGSTFCAPVSQALETGMISQQQQGSPNFAQSSFFAGQTIFDASTPSPQGFNRSAMFSSQPNLCMRNNVPGQVMGRQGQGHTNTLKALKRKLQENFSSTCKPIKVARMAQDISSGNGFMVSGGTPLPSSFESNSYRNIHGSSVAPQQAVTTGPVQMMYCLNNNVLPATKQKSVLSDPLPAFVEQTRLMQKAPSLEQVVPELSIPAFYPTPEPSPVSSPQPQMKQEILPSGVDPIMVAKHLCALRQKHVNRTQQSTKVSNAEPQKKLLPSLDVSFVDSFFDEIGTLDGQPLSIRGLLQRVKQEPVDVTDYTCLHTQEKQLPAFEQFDIDELFESSGVHLNNTCNNFIGMKMEIEDQRIPLCESQPSPTPSSPRSTVEDKLSYDDIMSSVVLTPESDFDTDHCEDLDPDSWMLETCNIDMSTKGLDLFAEPKLQTDFCLKKAGPCSDETELYQLKQLISSWTPSGVSESSEESQ
ncbi:neuronal PAS domain-containing protein 4B-like [Mizuhopecten yessoensis]|uniref:neuronal PAS domain-containing protein 4B-like n=1 Tax=Mizuhopecten yessoensis TaxID=6573 RepID=UPI000B45D856|nr:neuronal PAS domain-containing protein 4B-like [Mizuhopecten yessoensis]